MCSSSKPQGANQTENLQQRNGERSFFEIRSLVARVHHIHPDLPAVLLRDGRAAGAAEGQPSATAFFCLYNPLTFSSKYTGSPEGL